MLYDFVDKLAEVSCHLKVLLLHADRKVGLIKEVKTGRTAF